MKAVQLSTRRWIAAPPDRVFAAWTEPEHLERWWGPAEVTCPKAEVDLRIGGRYRIANARPTGEVLWICGVFEDVEPGRRLVYSWAHEPVVDGTETSRVTVRFEPRDGGTDVIVLHERLGSELSRTRHLAGWEGCLDGLAELLG